MGKAIVISGVSFASVSLGKVTPVDSIHVSDIAITGDNNVVRGFSGTYSIAYTPSDTTQRGVSWEIVGSPEGVTVNDGTVTVASSSSASSFTLKATSTYDQTVYATKVISVIDATILKWNSFLTGNISSSKKTAASNKYIHYNGIIECQQGDKFHFRFPPLDPSDYSGYMYFYKVIEFSSVPANLLTSAGLTLTSYITNLPSYTRVNFSTSGSVSEYEIVNSWTNYMYFQMGVCNGPTDMQMLSASSYGTDVSTVGKVNWASNFTNDDVLGYMYKE